MKTVIFGTGILAKEAFKYLSANNRYQIVAFSDNNQAKFGSYMENLEILSPKKLPQTSFDRIIIASQWHREIIRQLINIGIDSDLIEVFNCRMKGKVNGLFEYNHDGLKTILKHDFMDEPKFISAYKRGVKAWEFDPQIYWRVHVMLWAANIASKLKGDFVECGVNSGFMSSAVMEYLDWNSLKKTFYLLDTFNGLDEKYVLPSEISNGKMSVNNEALANGFYVDNVDNVKSNFAQWNNVAIIVGSVPETLDQVSSNKICFLHIDMNCVKPEIEALKYFWPKLVKGAVVLLDDYGFPNYEDQKEAMDCLSKELDFSILSQPTGQGLIIKN